MKGNRKRSRLGRGPAVVTRTCGRCDKRFMCLRGSVAEQLGMCRRCFERAVRFPGLCQRP
jgi:hypothetical protein